MTLCHEGRAHNPAITQISLLQDAHGFTGMAQVDRHCSRCGTDSERVPVTPSLRGLPGVNYSVWIAPAGDSGAARAILLGDWQIALEKARVLA